MNQRLLLLDGHSLAFRSFFALPKDAFRTDQGQYTNGIHGFLNTLLKLYADVQPTHVAVAFDLSGGTFRTKEYAPYKGGRAETPEEFKGQIPLIQEVLDTLGIAWITKDQYEADDIVATLSARGVDEGMDVVISSGDKDTYQLVNDNVTLLYPMPRSQMLEMTPDVVKERAGVTPEQYPDLAALVGEQADNLPGVPGVGPKTAQKWINQYGDLDGIIEHADEIGGKVGQSLRDNLDQVKLNRKLNHLLRDMPLEVGFEDLVPRGVNREAVHQLFDLLDFTSLRPRVLAELPLADGDTEQAGDAMEALEAAAASAGDIDDWLNEFGSETIGLFIEGAGSPHRGDITRISLALDSGQALVADRTDLSPKTRKLLLPGLRTPRLRRSFTARSGRGMRSRGRSVQSLPVLRWTRSWPPTSSTRTSAATIFPTSWSATLVLLCPRSRPLSSTWGLGLAELAWKARQAEHGRCFRFRPSCWTRSRSGVPRTSCRALKRPS
nr:5'-3' exonuclease H3TH domain-containing protein [Flaviflexus ciconiae]